MATTLGSAPGTVSKTRKRFIPSNGLVKNADEVISEVTSKPRHIVQVKAPNFQFATFEIRGTSPLVIHRFTAKAKQQILENIVEGKSAGSKKKREPKDMNELFEEARYRSKEGWDGFHAGAIRNGMISMCRLVNFKMTLAKLSVFVIADGRDRVEPQIPLIRIYGTPVKQEDIARVDNGKPYVTVRAAFHEWSAKIQIRWDKDQFTVEDVSNLLMRVGAQGGICEGRYDSKNSCGLGWGCFEIVGCQ